jgi:Protein of unknown function (DUF2793).
MTEKSPYLSLDILVPTEPVNDITINKWLTLLLWKVAPKVTFWQLNTGDDAPSNGYAVLVGDTPTGLFAGQAGKIAISYEGWFFRAPSAGLKVYDAQNDRVMIFNGTTWDEISYA